MLNSTTGKIILEIEFWSMRYIRQTNSGHHRVVSLLTTFQSELTRATLINAWFHVFGTFTACRGGIPWEEHVESLQSVSYGLTSGVSRNIVSPYILLYVCCDERRNYQTGCSQIWTLLSWTNQNLCRQLFKKSLMFIKVITRCQSLQKFDDVFSGNWQIKPYS